MRRECRKRFPPPLTSKETAEKRPRHVIAFGIAYPRWRGKRSRHSWRMRTRNITYLVRAPYHDYLHTTKVTCDVWWNRLVWNPNNAQQSANVHIYIHIHTHIYIYICIYICIYNAYLLAGTACFQRSYFVWYWSIGQCYHILFNILWLRQNERDFRDDIFNHVFLNVEVLTSMVSALVQAMAWGRTGTKSLSEPVMSLFTDA